MPYPSRRHTNQDFARSIGLLLAEIGFVGIMTFLFIGNVGDTLDKGILERMPNYQYEFSTDTIFLPSAHVLHLELTGGDVLRCEEVPISLFQLPKRIERHLYQAIEKDTLFFVSLRTERAAAYPVYLAAKDMIMFRQRDQLNELALQTFGEPYSQDMSFFQRKTLRDKLKLGLVEWVPDAGEEKLKVIRPPLWR